MGICADAIAEVAERKETALTARWTPHRPHPQQQAMWRTGRRFVVVAAGRRSGKTEIWKRRLVRALPVKKPWPDPRYFFGAPTQDQARLIAWDDLVALTPPDWVAWKHEGRMIKTVFGSELHVLGLDRPQRMEGPPWDGGYIDERADIRPKTFHLNVYPALADRHGWCAQGGVPKRKGVGALEFRQLYEYALRSGDPEWEAYTWHSSTVLPPGVIAQAKVTLSAKDYREQFEASWETSSGQAYDCFSREHNVRPCQYDPSRPLIVSQDFNVDPMAWVVLQERPGGVIEAIAELWVHDASTRRCLGDLHAMYPEHRAGWRFYGDAAAGARKTSADMSDYQIIAADERFVRAGRTIHYPASNPSVKGRVASVNMLLEDGTGRRRLYVDPRCARLVEWLEFDTWDETGLALTKGGDRTHVTDALGYYCHYEHPVSEMLEQVTVGAQVVLGAAVVA